MTPVMYFFKFYGLLMSSDSLSVTCLSKYLELKK